MAERKYILTKEVAEQKLQRMALEIAEKLDGDPAEIIIVGVRNSGKAIANKIGSLLRQHLAVPVKIISVILNKDAPKDIFFSDPTVDFNNKNVIVIDDVVNSGKTLLYALRPLLYFQPKHIQTLVLVERMHKLFPIKSDYIGLTIATTYEDNIIVEVKDGEIMGAYIA
ncbi:phosphoribosyltransferase family protein [Parasediminibacterium sp. JCM 36343]|uniref:phosphoribosyltransferase family protein n=1 Tax=Parasediminibacterium sp. JCM 36343 TaxID=3374279 RepID=UPI00397A40E3